MWIGAPRRQLQPFKLAAGAFLFVETNIFLKMIVFVNTCGYDMFLHTVENAN